MMERLLAASKRVLGRLGVRLDATGQVFALPCSGPCPFCLCITLLVCVYTHLSARRLSKQSVLALQFRCVAVLLLPPAIMSPHFLFVPRHYRTLLLRPPPRKRTSDPAVGVRAREGAAQEEEEGREGRSQHQGPGRGGYGGRGVVADGGHLIRRACRCRDDGGGRCYRGVRWG